MRVQVVDPPAYTPPYDRSLCAALAAAGADVELITSPFRHGSVPPAPGVEVHETFHVKTSAGPPDSRRWRLLRGIEHLTDMLRYRRQEAQRADLIHFQWLPVPRIDVRLLPRGRPLVLTPHGMLRGDAWGTTRSFERLLDRMDALVALTEYGAGVLRESAGIDAERIRVIPHGPLDYLTRLPEEVPLPSDLAAVEGPVVLYFGLIRPYKGVDVLLEAFREVDGAELWVIGRPFGVDRDDLVEAAGRCRSTVRLVPRFVDDAEIPALFRRADLVVLPHREAEQSGVLFTALAFAKAMVMSDVGGFGEVAAHGAGGLVAPEDPVALAEAIADLLADDGERARLEQAAAAAAAGPYSWPRIAELTLDLYRELLSE